MITLPGPSLTPPQVREAGGRMSCRIRTCGFYAVIICLAAVGGCSSLGPVSSLFSSIPLPFQKAAPPRLRAEDILGRWGFAAYHREQDRPQVELLARRQCSSHSYLISKSVTADVAMLNPDNAQAVDVKIKGSVEGKTYLGPETRPGDADDREVVSFRPTRRQYAG